VRVVQRMRAVMHADDDGEKLSRPLLGETLLRDIPPRAVLLYGAIFVALACAVEIANRRFLYFGTDGLFWEVLQAYHPYYGSWSSTETSDPLQGMFDIFPHGYRGTVLLDWFSTLPLDLRVISALIHSSYTAFAVVSVYIMARSVGATRRAGLLAAILTPVLILPGLLGSTGLLSHQFAIGTHYSYLISGIVLVIGLYWRIDGQLNAKFFLSALVAFFVTVEACNAFPLDMTLLFPAVLVFGAGGLVASETRGEFNVKLGWAVAILAGLVLLGMPAYLYGLGSNTAVRFFYDELNDFALRAIPTNANLKDDVFYVLQWRPVVGGVVAAIVSSLGIAAATFFALFGASRRLRIFARCFVVLVFGTGIIAFVCHYWFYFAGYDFKGPNPFHMVYVLWPFHIIFLGLLIEGVLGLLVRAAAGIRARKQVATLAGQGVLAAALALPLCGLVVLKEATYFDLTTKPNAIIDYLRAHNAVTLGAPYRGVVATFIGTLRRRLVQAAAVQS